MDPQSNIIKAAAEEVPAELENLGIAIGRLPAEHREVILSLYRQVVENTKRRRRILTLVQEALSQLRLDMKYLMFDLEATRRERDEFRRKIENNNS